MESMLEDLIDEAASLSHNKEIQITVHGGIAFAATVHYFDPGTGGSLEWVSAPTLREALNGAIKDMRYGRV